MHIEHQCEAGQHALDIPTHAEDRKDNVCFLGDHEVLPRAEIWLVLREERANDQTMVKFSRGRWWMT